jgi:hypothetical protein
MYSSRYNTYFLSLNHLCDTFVCVNPGALLAKTELVTSQTGDTNTVPNLRNFIGAQTNLCAPQEFLERNVCIACTPTGVFTESEWPVSIYFEEKSRKTYRASKNSRRSVQNFGFAIV